MALTDRQIKRQLLRYFRDNGIHYKNDSYGLITVCMFICRCVDGRVILYLPRSDNSTVIISLTFHSPGSCYSRILHFNDALFTPISKTLLIGQHSRIIKEKGKT